jgi:hypothetical protein
VAERILPPAVHTDPDEPEKERRDMRSEDKAKVAAANTAREARTLEDLGVPGTLAHDLERTLRLMGRVKGDRIEGYTFRTTDGSSYALKVSAPAATDAGERAA